MYHTTVSPVEKISYFSDDGRWAFWLGNPHRELPETWVWRSTSRKEYGDFFSRLTTCHQCGGIFVHPFGVLEDFFAAETPTMPARYAGMITEIPVRLGQYKLRWNNFFCLGVEFSGIKYTYEVRV